MHFTIDRHGYRSSTFSAFLPYKLVNERKQHLHICTSTIVLKVETQNGADGAVQAEGMVVQSNGHSLSRLIRARRKVIVSAGPIGSPQLLMLSGIGPEAHLKEHNTPVMKNFPASGRICRITPVQYRVPLYDSLVKLELRPWIIIKEIILYLFFGMGLLLALVLELCIFVQSRRFDAEFCTLTSSNDDEDASLPISLPDIEVMPIAYSDITASKIEGRWRPGVLRCRFASKLYGYCQTRVKRSSR
ncbi:hypothetical protein AcW2_007008 [Taiwanofungus camphoratus]|nr:hypothetical protein AcW2_007008 [Antrodia cinnamomea]